MRRFDVVEAGEKFYMNKQSVYRTLFFAFCNAQRSLMVPSPWLVKRRVMAIRSEDDEV